MRDAAGGEKVLFHLPGERDSGETLVLWRERDAVSALYRGRIAESSARELGPGLRLFFHLNDTSAVRLEALRVTGRPAR